MEEKLLSHSNLHLNSQPFILKIAYLNPFITSSPCSKSFFYGNYNKCPLSKYNNKTKNFFYGSTLSLCVIE